jgi:septum formation protein
MRSHIKLVLASQSAHRLNLLRTAGYQVTALPAHVEEPNPAACGNLRAGLLHVAQLKAMACRDAGARGLILAADTVGLVNGRVLGKPADRADALRMLRAISGTAHDVLTGWCLLRSDDGLFAGGVETTRIEMRGWTDREIAEYLESGQWKGKCGAYGLVVPKDPFVVGIDGSASNVIGVPLERLQQVLREFPALCREASAEP